MPQLSTCKLCGKLFDGHAPAIRKGLCAECIASLAGKYSRIHEYIRSSKDEISFDPEYLSKMTDVSLEDIELLISMGYLERDMQTSLSGNFREN